MCFTFHQIGYIYWLGIHVNANIPLIAYPVEFGLEWNREDQFNVSPYRTLCIYSFLEPGKPK